MFDIWSWWVVALAFIDTKEGRLVSSATSAASAIIATLGLWWHRRRETFTWHAQRLLYLHQFLATPHLMNARRTIRHAIEHGAEPRQWGEREDRAADIVSAAYDQAGILLFAPGSIAPKQLYYFLRSSWGASIQEMYKEIEAREKCRSDRRHDLQNYFVHFKPLRDAARDTEKYKWFFPYRRWWVKWHLFRWVHSNPRVLLKPRTQILAVAVQDDGGAKGDDGDHRTEPIQSAPAAGTPS
jgi:hypothetical protein